MSATAAIITVELRRFLRERGNLFFVFVLPLLLVVFIGVQFGTGAGTSVGVVTPAGDDLTEAVVADLDARDAIRVEPVDDEATLVAAVRRGNLAGGVVLPEGYGDAAGRGEVLPVRFIGSPDGGAPALRRVVEAVVGPRGATADAARLAASASDLDQDVAQMVGLAEQLREQVPSVEVSTSAVGDGGLAEEFAGLGQFDLGASSQLFLFVFLTALASSTALIQSRQLGVATRMRATPTTVAAILIGLAGGRFLVALLQAAYLVVATRLLFGVDWGDPLASGLLIVTFCAVGAGAATVLGAALRNDQQAGGLAVGLGLVVAALGGSMVPLDVFPDAARSVALLTPHGWANTAMAELVRRDGTLGDIGIELAVLGAYAVALLTLGTVLLRRALARG